MSLDLSKFQAASKAAEGWLNTVGHVARLGRCGSVTPALELLMPTPSTKDGRPYNLQDSYCEHAEVLEQVQDALAALSDSPVKWEHGRGLSGIARVPAAVYPHIWSSAHEAAAGIARLALRMLVWPLAAITDPVDQRTLAEQLLAKCSTALTIPLDEQAVLFERIRRERAKLLAQYSPRAENAEKTTSQILPKPDVESGPKAQDDETGNFLRLEGEVWRIHYEDSEAAFPDRKDSALRHLARLLDEPNRRSPVW
jgi:hypothetical protein